jgi:hypothetical protein
MNRGALSDLSFIGSFERPPIKKRHPAKCKEAHSKDPDKKRGTLQNATGLIEKTFDEKRGTPQNAKGLIQKTSDEKRGTPQNAKRLVQKTSVKKEAPHKTQKGYF